MDQGIIANFKRHYRSLVLRQLMGVTEATDENDRAAELARKLTLLDSLPMQFGGVESSYAHNDRQLLQVCQLRERAGDK